MNVIVGRLIFLLSFFVILFCSGCSENIEDESLAYLENARNLISQNKPETALIEYKKAVQLDPDDEIALFEMAETYVVLGQINQATRYYNLVVSANPESTQAYLRLAQIHMMTDRLLDARGYVSKTLEIAPQSVEAHHLLSSIQIRERDFRSAIKTLEFAVSLDTKNSKTYISLAQLYIQTQSVENAEAAYLKAIESDPASRSAYMGYVKLLVAQRRWPDIEPFFMKILKTDGNTSEKHMDLAEFYLGRKKYDLAEENYQKALDLAEKKVIPFMKLAEFYAKRKMKDQAIVTMKNALLIEPGNPMIHSSLSEIYLHFNMPEQSLDAVNSALKIDSQYIDALFQKGRVLYATKKFKKALDLFDQVLSINRIYAKAYYYRALCIDKRGATDRPEQEIFRAAAGQLDKPEAFEKDQIKGNLLAAIKIDPGMIDARIKLTEIFIKDREIKKGKEQIDEILKVSAPNIKILTLLSGLKIAEGNYEEAENILKSIIREKPDYLAAHIRLGLLYKSLGDIKKSIDVLKSTFDKNKNQVRILNIIVNVLIAEEKASEALHLVSNYAETADPVHNAYYENLKGEIQLANNDTQSALAHFRASKEHNQNYIIPKFHLADFFMKRQEFQKAMAEFKDILALHPNQTYALMNVGIIHDVHKQFDKAEEYYRRVLTNDPRHPDAANNLAFLLSDKPKYLEEALNLVQTALNEKPDDPNILDTLGWIYYRKGNFLNALSILEDCVSVIPDSALANFHYGMVLYQGKDYEKARKYIKKALELNPGIKNADLARKMLN